MAQQNQIWVVELSNQDGRLVASRNQLPLSQATQQVQASNGQSTAVLVEIKANLALHSALVTTRGELPIGVVPIEIGQNQEKKGFWVNLGFSSVSNNNNGQYEASSLPPLPVPESNNGDNGNGAANLMTEKQRRYLFRLLAERNVNGKEAETYLKGALRVRDLNQAQKKAASELIERFMAGEGQT